MPYVVGVAWYRELAKAMIMGENDGLLKILVSPEDHSLLGVHVIGQQATDLVHIGQALMGRPGALDFLVSVVFNYPTLAEAYKTAGLDAQTGCATCSESGRTAGVTKRRSGGPPAAGDAALPSVACLAVTVARSWTWSGAPRGRSLRPSRARRSMPSASGRTVRRRRGTGARRRPARTP